MSGFLRSDTNVTADSSSDSGPEQTGIRPSGWNALPVELKLNILRRVDKVPLTHMRDVLGIDAQLEPLTEIPRDMFGRYDFVRQEPSPWAKWLEKNAKMEERRSGKSRRKEPGQAETKLAILDKISY